MDKLTPKTQTNKSTNLQKNAKRKNIDNDTDSDPEQNTNLDMWPRFLMIESMDENKPLTKVSPFALQKAIEGIAGIPKTFKGLRSGTFLIELNKKSHTTNLLKCAMLVDVPVRITPHRTLNFKKGVIRAHGLKECSVAELQEHLGPQGVTEVIRITIKKDNNIIPTNTFILTFATPTLPSKIKVAYLSLDVQVYIPSPLRCFKCQRFGHHKNACKQTCRCARCGSEKHLEGNCSAEPICCNCKGEHPAFSRECPLWLKEKEIQKIKTLENISYLDAKKIVEGNVGAKPAASYAQVASANAQVASIKVPTITQHVQTHLSWPNNTKAAFHLPDKEVIPTSHKTTTIDIGIQTSPSREEQLSTTTLIPTSPPKVQRYNKQKIPPKPITAHKPKKQTNRFTPLQGIDNEDTIEIENKKPIKRPINEIEDKKPTKRPIRAESEVVPVPMEIILHAPEDSMEEISSPLENCPDDSERETDSDEEDFTWSSLPPFIHSPSHKRISPSFAGHSRHEST